jgi:hypothetical protein
VPAAKDTDPSPEVPDLQNGEVAAIKQVIASDREEALRLMLTALQRIDAKAFSSDDLEDHKLHLGTSKTRQGKAFEAWLKTYFDKFAEKRKKDTNKLKPDEVKKAIDEARPLLDADPGAKDIRVTIANGHFETVSMLYSTVRHEFIHVQQLRKDYLAHVSQYVMPAGLLPPGSGTFVADSEIEAYLWEMEHLANTGVTDPRGLETMLDTCIKAFENASAGARNAAEVRIKAAIANVWKKAMDGHVALIADHYKNFKASGTVAEPGMVEVLKDALDRLWLHRTKFDNPWTGHVAAHKTAVDQANEMLAWAKADRFTKLLDTIDQEVKTPYTDAMFAVSRWQKLHEDWNALEAASKTSLQARFDATAPVLWEKTFDALETDVRASIARNELVIAQETMNVSIAPLLKKPEKGITTEPFVKRRQALQTEINDAKKAKKP